ncbi:MAG: AAA family ATPase [Anaeroplasmataceae bacterium]
MQAQQNDTVLQLKNEFAQAKTQLVVEAKKYKAKKDPDVEDKKAMRAAIAKCSNLAKKLSEAVDDPQLREAYRKDFLYYVEKSQQYGSTVKGEIPKTKLADVKGLKDVKSLIYNFIHLTKNPEILKAYKLSSGLGLLMYGPPGTGKTLIAEAIANELQVPFFLVTPSDIFKSHVGESEEAVKMLFYDIEQCEEGAVLFIDECESIFSRRDENTERYQAAVTTELLQRMNGFGVNGDKRVIIAATNRPEMIDPAYLRYKRFSNVILVDLPDREAMTAIIESKLKGMPIDPSVDVKTLVDIAMEEGRNLSGADISGIIETTALKAIDIIREKNLDAPIPLTLDMFKDSFDKHLQSISDEALAQYHNFKVE